MEIDFSKLITVAGVDDLFEFSHAQNDNVIVKSLKTNKLVIYSMNRSKVMNLSNIQVYTIDGMIDLKELMLLIKASSTPLPPNANDKEAYYQFFLSICPQLDRTKVYFNNLKQILKWHVLLKEGSFTFQ